MAKRRGATRTTHNASSYSEGAGRQGKSAREARIERFTWFFLVLIFAIVQLLSENTVKLPGWFVPMAGAIVLLGSGIYQYSRRYRVSPITWLGGGLLLIFAMLNLYTSLDRSFIGESLLVFAGVILAGLLTGET